MLIEIHIIYGSSLIKFMNYAQDTIYEFNQLFFYNGGLNDFLKEEKLEFLISLLCLMTNNI